MRDREQAALSAWVRLLKAHALLLREARRGLPEGLTLPQFDVLVQLERRPQGMTAAELTRELLVTAGNLTGIVDRLATAGLVSRSRDARDARARRLRLTASGRRRLGRALPRHARAVSGPFLALSRPELRQLRELLGRLGQPAREDA
ncbi:MAG: MarR family winged helix-turn-helix transcriptional regulator [Vicinamibacteria bacterium]